MTRLAKILNNVIILAILSLVIFAWIKRFTNNQMLSIILCAMIITIIATELHYFSKKRTNRLNLKNQELKFMQNCIWHFLESPNSKNVAFFKSLLKQDMSFKNNTKFLLTTDNLTMLAPCFESQELSCDILLTLIKQANNLNVKTLIIFCASENKNTKNIIQNATNLKIIILNDYETFGLMKSKNFYPISQEPVKKTKKQHALFSSSNFFGKLKVKPFLLCGLFLYFSSLFVTQKTYYIILASICLILSAVSLIFAKNPKTTSGYEAIFEK